MSFMRPLVAEFPEDRRTWDEKGSFLFGCDILVAPVTSSNVTSVATYLPQGADWYNYFTGERVKGGAEHEMKTDLSNFPMYVRAGAILVDGPDVQYVGEKPWNDLAVTVYPGANGSFELYEDAGDGYDYEKGAFSTVGFSWNDKTKTLTIGARKGAYPGMLKDRTFRVKTLGGAEKTVKYSGKAVKVSL
jgi:alpha-D-xyloside xylohydrolase